MSTRHLPAGARDARPSAACRAIAFAAKGRLVVTGYVDGVARAFGASRPAVRSRTFAAHNGAVQSVAFSPDGTLLAAAEDDTTAKLWDLRTDKRLLTLRGHSRAVTSLAFSPDGTRLASGAPRRDRPRLRPCRSTS